MSNNRFHKKYDHRGYEYYVNVNLFDSVDRGLDGNTNHRVTVSGPEHHPYHVEYLFVKKNSMKFDSKEFGIFIERAKLNFMEWLDERLDKKTPEEETYLTEFGFSRVTEPPPGR